MPSAVLAYVRVSSKAQDLAMQRASIERAAAVRGDTVHEWFAEKASARTVVRPELDRLRACVRAGRATRLYVFRLDCLARTGIRDMFELVEEMRDAGVQLVTVADGFNLDGPAAEVILAVLAWAAKMERLATNERIAAARERLAAEGRPWGRPPRLDARGVEQVKSLRAQGRSLRQIAMGMKVPKTTVLRALRAATD